MRSTSANRKLIQYGCETFASQFGESFYSSRLQVNSSHFCSLYLIYEQIHDVVIWALQRNSWANCYLSEYLGIVPKKFPILSMSTLFNKISRKRFFSVVFVTKIKYKVCEIVLISLLKLSNKPEHRKWKQKKCAPMMTFDFLRGCLQLNYHIYVLDK